MAGPRLAISGKRHAVWAGGYQFVSLILNVVRGIVLVPLYLEYISVAEYGFWIVLRTTIGWLFIVNPGFADLVRARTARYIGSGTLDKIWNDGIIAIILNLALGIIILIMATGVSFYLPQILGVVDETLVERLTHTFFILVAGMLLMLFAYVMAGINDGLHQGAQTGATLAIANIVSIVASVIGLRHGLGIYALALSYIVLPAIYMALVSGFVWRNLNRLGVSFPRKLENFSSLASEASVNFRGRIASLASHSVDRWLVARFLGPEAVVSYDMLKRVPETCFGMMSQFPHALAPTLSLLGGADQPDALAHWGTRVLTLLSVGCLSLAAVIISLNRDFIGLWVGQDFYPSFQADVALVLWLTFAALINSAAVLLVAVGQVRSSVKVLTLYSGLLLPGLVLGIYYGNLVGFTWAGAMCGGICVLVKLRKNLAVAYSLNPEQQRQLLKGTLLALGVGCAVVGAAEAFPVATWPLLIAKGAMVSLATVFLLWASSVHLRKELVRALRTFLPKIGFFPDARL